MKRLIFDLDDTICFTENQDYANAVPNMKLINKMQEYKNNGFDIVINTSRNMRTFDGNKGKINKHTLPLITQWLNKHNVPYDEVYIGKPWCGFDGFYIDDKAIRPDEFESLTYDQIITILKKDK